MPGILEGLNESQKQAVTAAVKHLLVIAGPGTGKTLTIVRRIAYLLQQGVPPDQIIAVTFTNRAAREMRERIETYVGLRSVEMFVGTFHVLGLTILRESLSEQFAVCTREDQIDLLKQIVGSSTKARSSLEKISRLKNSIEEPDPEMQRVYEAYENELRRNAMRDFDDLILLPVNLFETGRAARRFSNVPKHIIVDEYQDIAAAQYRFLKSLAGAHPLNTLCAVGDSDQAIYGFRGADVQNFLDFRRDFPDSASVVLGENFRSTRTIMAAADMVIRNNVKRMEKEVRARKETGVLIRTVLTSDEMDEAEFIVREIESRVGGTSHFRMVGNKTPRDYMETSYAFSDFSVLFRTNTQAGVLRQAFEQWGIPCQLVGERHAFRKKKLIETLRSHMDTLPEEFELAKLLQIFAREAGVRAEDKELLFTIAEVYRHLPTRKAISETINELTLFTSADAFNPKVDAVALMTLHMAKGLEFKVVFVAGCEESLLPFVPARGDADVEEERRLFYVGMTRAKDELLLLHARKRMIYGRVLSRVSSRFVREIPKEFVIAESLQEKPKKPKPPQQPGLF
ncbi:MAG TPA: UvrD-helicase domain-containing protein [Syntrophorhabdales bacterium]|nr:UvrD-helicase domain-containing protein [Syntrophorhabdales bacterium]